MSGQSAEGGLKLGGGGGLTCHFPPHPIRSLEFSSQFTEEKAEAQGTSRSRSQ